MKFSLGIVKYGLWISIRKAHASTSKRAQHYLKDAARSSDTSHRQLRTIKRKLNSLQLIFKAKQRIRCRHLSLNLVKLL
jgi:hypothetical protein